MNNKTINKDLLVSRIMSGMIRCPIYDRLNNKTVFIVKAPSIEIKYEAEEVYNDAYEEAVDEGILTREEMFGHLEMSDSWNKDKEEAISKLPKEIEETKVHLFGLTFKSNERKATRKKLEALKNAYEKLINEKYSMDYATCEGYASLAKMNFIISKTLYLDNKLVTYIDDSLLNSINACLIENRITEKTYREMARTEPWRGYWNLQKSEVFGIPPSCFSDEQKSLCLWSKMYDNIYENPECPHDSIVEDDDMLDGWLIIQRRKREVNMDKKEGEDLIKGKMAKADEIYIVADSYEDALKVDSMNSPMAKIVKAQRNAIIQKQGMVKEQDLPDRVQQRLIGGN